MGEEAIWEKGDLGSCSYSGELRTGGVKGWAFQLFVQGASVRRVYRFAG